MNAVDFDAQKHHKLASEWFSKRWNPLPVDELPTIGVMVYDNNKPVLCGFLITTNAKFAYIELVISNPKTTDIQRDEAVQCMDSALCQKAKDLGYRRTMCFPYMRGLAKKAENSGYKFFKRKCYLGIKEI